MHREGAAESSEGRSSRICIGREQQNLHREGAAESA